MTAHFGQIDQKNKNIKSRAKENFVKKVHRFVYSKFVKTCDGLFIDEEMYDKKDPYGNKDLLPAAKSMRMLDNVWHQLGWDFAF